MTSAGDADRPTRPPNARRKSTDDRVKRGLHGVPRTKSQTQLDVLSRKAPQKNTGKASTRTEQVDDQSENNWTSASPSSSPEVPSRGLSSKEASPRIDRLNQRATAAQSTAESDPLSPTQVAHETGTGAPSTESALRDPTPEGRTTKRAQTLPDSQTQAPSTSPPGMRPSQSMRSIRSRRSMLLGRDAFQPTAPVAPVLDTRRVTSTQHGIETDERPSQAPARFYLGEQEDARVPVSRPSMHSLGSSSNLTLEEMGQEHAHAPQFARSRADSVSSLTSLMERTPGMRRTTSTQSLNETHLQRSMSSHEHLTQLLQRNLGMRRGSAMPSVSSESSGPVRVGAGGTGSKLMASTFANLLHGRPVERQAKPIVSKFARYQQQFDPSASAQSVLARTSHADNVPGRVISVDVPPTSVFSEGFVDRVKAQLSHEDMRPRRSTDDSVQAPQQYRYLLDYGLSGPSIDKDSLSHIELTPRVDSGLPLDSPTVNETPMRVRGNLRAASTPRLDQSVAERAKLVVPDSATTLGPNMIPFHFIHALTSTFENALALDRAEVPAMASLLPGVADRDDPMFVASPPDADTVPDSAGEAEEHVHFIDNQSMRAIAYTAQAVSIQRIHTVTRRFSDPFREALVRVADASGYMAYLRTQEHAGQASVAKRPGQHGAEARGGSGSLWHRGSYRDRPHAADARHSSPSLTRSNTALAALGSLAGRAESPRHAGVRGRVN